jgi:hypothetical protein
VLNPNKVNLCRDRSVIIRAGIAEKGNMMSELFDVLQGRDLGPRIPKDVEQG